MEVSRVEYRKFYARVNVTETIAKVGSKTYNDKRGSCYKICETSLQLSSKMFFLC